MALALPAASHTPATRRRRYRPDRGVIDEVAPAAAVLDEQLARSDRRRGPSVGPGDLPTADVHEMRVVERDGVGRLLRDRELSHARELALQHRSQRHLAARLLALAGIDRA